MGVDVNAVEGFGEALLEVLPRNYHRKKYPSENPRNRNLFLG